ncbi:MAG: hypothetical protein AB7V04_10355 [Desulfomonilaceae bacterium]
MKNICRPDKFKSCAACCGLYNVADASERSLGAELRKRSFLFRDVPRNVNDLVNFKQFIARSGSMTMIDPDIHVCEFIGFLDQEEHVVGCMLHPDSTGNKGIDFRGLCHYGAMACKSFYCPAWTELPQRIRIIVAAGVPDWRNYGLVVTDVSFCLSIVGLIEGRISRELSTEILNNQKVVQTLGDLLMLKDTWPFGSRLRLRRSAYYLKNQFKACSEDDLLRNVLSSLSFTYGVGFTGREFRDLIMAKIDESVNVIRLAVDSN